MGKTAVGEVDLGELAPARIPDGKRRPPLRPEAEGVGPDGGRGEEGEAGGRGAGEPPGAARPGARALRPAGGGTRGTYFLFSL